MRPLTSGGARLTILLMLTSIVTASATSRPVETVPAPRSASAAVRVPRVVPTNGPEAAKTETVETRTGTEGPVLTTVLAVPAALVDATLPLQGDPVAVPLELLIPVINVAASVIGVGITANDVMDAPKGDPEDPVWQQAFWYRGSAVPGAQSTALIAGHVNDRLGHPGVFGRIDVLLPGDLIVVHDTRTGLDVNFAVTDTENYPIDETTTEAVLDQIYGNGPVAGTGPQPSADGLSHLTLITCSGDFRNGTHDHRFVVYAVRTA